MSVDIQQTARSVSVEILNQFDEDTYLDWDKANDLDRRDRAQVREYVQGIFRKRSYLDFLIGHYASVGLDDMKSNLKNILRLAMYDFLFMDSTPDYAAIDEAVKLAKLTMGHRTGDLVNAIMRNLQRDSENLPKPQIKDRTKLIATTFSHPEWLVARWVKRFGEREAFQLMQANNQRPHYYVRLNTLRTKPEYFKLRMEKSDVGFQESDWLPGFFSVESTEPFISKGWLDKGLCTIQDVAAGLAPTILDPQPGESIYDFCAAPGTKSIMIADMMGGEGSVLAVDSSNERLTKLSENALNCQAENIKIRGADVRDLEADEADGILLDAPCTGTGVLAKRADLRWRRTPEELEDMVELQKELLDASAQMVKKGGRLVYSTCSLETEENWDQVQAFLDRHDNFELESLDGYVPDEVLFQDGMAYQTFPHKHHTDGHFGVRMKRVK
ncbi:MAG: 16S rRNA (cytosine(967)-C(5))-methyltransferase RsmB [Bacteroidota bacterium]